MLGYCRSLNGSSPTFCVCLQQNETTDHIVSTCSLLAPAGYLDMQDKAAQYITWVYYENLNLLHDKNWLEDKSPPLYQNDQISFLWNFIVQAEEAQMRIDHASY